MSFDSIRLTLSRSVADESNWITTEKQMLKLEHITEDLTTSIPSFIQYSQSFGSKRHSPEIPNIKGVQNRRDNQFVNLATIATFFSSVTATALQLSSSNTEPRLANAANGFFYSSLVFSTAAAVMCLMALGCRDKAVHSMLRTFCANWHPSDPNDVGFGLQMPGRKDGDRKPMKLTGRDCDF